jgi:hypothetical protein
LDARQIANREIVKREIGEKKNIKEVEKKFCIVWMNRITKERWVERN